MGSDCALVYVGSHLGFLMLDSDETVRGQIVYRGDVRFGTRVSGSFLWMEFGPLAFLDHFLRSLLGSAH